MEAREARSTGYDVHDTPFAWEGFYGLSEESDCACAVRCLRLLQWVPEAEALCHTVRVASLRCVDRARGNGNDSFRGGRARRAKDALAAPRPRAGNVDEDETENANANETVEDGAPDQAATVSETANDSVREEARHRAMTTEGDAHHRCAVTEEAMGGAVSLGARGDEAVDRAPRSSSPNSRSSTGPMGRGGGPACWRQRDRSAWEMGAPSRCRRGRVHDTLTRTAMLGPGGWVAGGSATVAWVGDQPAAAAEMAEVAEAAATAAVVAAATASTLAVLALADAVAAAVAEVEIGAENTPTGMAKAPEYSPWSAVRA